MVTIRSPYFQYGTDASFGQTTTADDLGSGSSAVPFNAVLNGLQGGTTYYYRLVTSSNGLTSTYATQTFTTAGGTPVVANDTPVMPPAGLIVLAIGLIWVSAGLMKRKGEGLAG